MWGLLPLLAAWICTRFAWIHWFHPRYFITIAPAFYLLFCAVIGRLQQPVIKTAGILIVICAWGGLGHSVAKQHKKGTVAEKTESWKEIVEHLNAQPGRGNVLLLSGLIEDPQLAAQQQEVQSGKVPLQQYCQFPVRGLYSLEQRWNVTALSSDTSADALQSYLLTPRTWIIIRGSRRILQWEQFTQQTFHQQQYSRIEFPGNVALFTWRK
jgi:hypothetical protein